jgi:hypothetical protein
MQLLKQIADQYDESRRSQAVWKMTPFAWSACCMIPIGKGRYLGDVMYEAAGPPRLFGSLVEVLQGNEATGCRLALVDPIGGIEEWIVFQP